MNIFAIHVKTRDEEKYIKLFHADNPDKRDIRIYFPKRELRVRKQGKVVAKIAPVFAGYVFVEIENDDDIMNHHWALHNTNGFFRFLPSNKVIREMRGLDLEVAIHFIKQKGQIAGVSKVYFDDNDRIVIKDGPLLGLEGHIVKVDRRKRRAKVKLDLYGESFSIDLSFTMIDPQKAAASTPSQGKPR
jgi:transcriptional antiterminator NusG